MGRRDHANDDVGRAGGEDIVAVDLAPLFTGRGRGKPAAARVDGSAALPFLRGEDGAVGPLIVVDEILFWQRAGRGRRGLQRGGGGDEGWGGQGGECGQGEDAEDNLHGRSPTGFRFPKGGQGMFRCRRPR